MPSHHGDAILKLAGITGFTDWKSIQPETVAPRRLPDGLIEVRFPSETELTLVLVEIESYSASDVDRQVLDDLMLIAVDRKQIPEVVSLVLKQKGKCGRDWFGRVRQSAGSNSNRWFVASGAVVGARCRIVVRGRRCRADPVGATVSHHRDTGKLLMTRCRDRLATVPDPSDRAGLMAVTQILASLAFPDRRFLNLFGGAQAMIESPFLDEVKEILRKQYIAEATAKTLRENVIAVLEARFGSIPPDRVAPLNTVADETRLRALLRLASRCPDVDAFLAGLVAGA